MSDNKVTLDQLDNSAVEAMSSSVGDVSMLNTENKTIVGALAEIVGKKEIANAIGEPLAETDKFTEMSSEINGLLSTFKTNMMNAGVVVESEDKFKALIDKIKGLTEGEGNKGIQFAEGQATFDADRTLTSNNCFVNYDLDFTPTYLFVKFDAVFNANEWCYNVILTNWCEIIINNSAFQLALVDVTDKSCLIADHIGSNDATILADTVYYCAIGVGEEDTTLRDSLASILTEEGVEVTEEDDMTSLITKVDEEFTNKENEISSLEAELADAPPILNISSEVDYLSESRVDYIMGNKDEYTIKAGEYFEWVCPFKGSLYYSISYEGAGAGGYLTFTGRQYRKGQLIYESDSISFSGSGTESDAVVFNDINPGDRLCVYAQGSTLYNFGATVIWLFV